jgi:DNA-binding IclR family transcriptional regulator
MTALTSILDALKEGAATVEDLCDATGIPRDSCRAHLSELSRAGHIRRTGYVEREVIQTRKAALYGLAP